MLYMKKLVKQYRNQTSKSLALYSFFSALATLSTLVGFWALWDFLNAALKSPRNSKLSAVNKQTTTNIDARLASFLVFLKYLYFGVFATLKTIRTPTWTPVSARLPYLKKIKCRFFWS